MRKARKLRNRNRKTIFFSMEIEREIEKLERIVLENLDRTK